MRHRRTEGAAARRTTSCWRTSVVRVVLDAPRIRPAWRRPAVRSSTSRPWSSELGRPDQLDLPGGRPAPARRRSLRQRRAAIEGTASRRHYASRSCFAATWRANRRVTVVTRYELRACEPGVRVRTDLYNGVARTEHAVPRRRICSGATTTPCRSFPARGSVSARPSWICATSRARGGSGRSSPRGRRRRPTSRTRSSPAIARRRAGFNNPTLTAAGVPLTTTLPGDGIHFERFILAAAGPGPRAGGRRGAARPRDGSRRAGAGDRHGPGRRRRDGRSTASSGGRRRCCSTSPRSVPTPTIPARRKPWTRRCRTATGASTSRCRRIAATACSRTRSGCRPRPPTSFAVERGRRGHGRHHAAGVRAPDGATVTTAPGQPAAGPTTYAELVLVPVERRRRHASPQLVRPVPGLRSDAGTAARRLARRATARSPSTGSFDLLIPPGHYYVYATRGPFATIDRAEIARRPGRRDGRCRPLVVQSLPMLLPAGVAVRRLPRSRRRQLRLRRSPTRIASSASWPRASTSSSRPITTSSPATQEALADLPHRAAHDHPGRRADAEHPVVRRARRGLPADARALQLLAARAATRRCPRNGAPWDELREPGQMMDDIEPLFDRPAACGSSIIRSRTASWGATRGSCAPSATTRARRSCRAPASPPTCCCGQPGGARQAQQHRLGRAGGDERRVARRTGCATGRSGSRCCRRASCARGPPTATRTRWRSSRSAIRATSCSASHQRRATLGRRGASTPTSVAVTWSARTDRSST